MRLAANAKEPDTGKGARPSENGQRPSSDSEYSRFERLTKRLLRVSKKEITEQERKGKG